MNENEGARARPREGVWAVPDVNRQPVVELECWRVFEPEGGRGHLVGWNARDREGRVSTAVAAFDPARRVCMTASDRRYVLVGPPGHHVDAEWLWQCWCEARGITRVVDVTDTYARWMEAAR